MEFIDANFSRQPSTGNWPPVSRSTSTGYGRRLFDNGYEYGTSTPYYQMGEPKRGGWSGILKRMFLLRRSKKKIFEPSGVNNLYDPCSYMQNFDRGSARMEPENLSRSFSSQFANPSGFLERMR